MQRKTAKELKCSMFLRGSAPKKIFALVWKYLGFVFMLADLLEFDGSNLILKIYEKVRTSMRCAC